MVFRVKRSSVFTVLLILCGVVRGQAAVIRVPTDQPTIKAAISAAVNGDTIQVAPGTYIENINFLGKAISVVSDQGPQVTVIDGNQSAPVVTFNSGEGPQSILNGFTLRNNIIANNTAGSQGGGISLVNNSDASIVQNVITGNAAPTGGGVYWLVPSGSRGPFLINNTVSANNSPRGSGLFADGFDQQVQLINNIIVAAAGKNEVVCGDC